jgi:putative ABC transport system ATP-binding protein
MIIANKLKRIYETGEVKVHALKGVDLKVKEGEFIAIMGASGSGKSTLLHLLGLLDNPTDGSLVIDGSKVLELSDYEKTMFRLKHLGYVFQEYALIPELTALENVYIAAFALGKNKEKSVKEAKRLLKLVGLNHREDHYPSQLSGGEQQRVAVARALINKPKILLADEPTANLDTEASLNIVGIFKKLNKSLKQTIIMVTHEKYLGKHAQRIILVKNGLIEK